MAEKVKKASVLPVATTNISSSSSAKMKGRIIDLKKVENKALRLSGSVGSLNVFGRSNSGTIKEKTGLVVKPSGGSMANLRTESSNNVTGVTEDSVGRQVIIAGVQKGILRYFGELRFKPGLWCGVELATDEGNGDGSVDGVQYFKCLKNRGIFVPTSKVTLAQENQNSSLSNNRRWSISEERKGSKPKQEAKVVEQQPTKTIKGSKRPKLEERERTFTVHKEKVDKKNSNDEKKRRKLDKEPLNLNPTMGKKVPNFAEINQLNLQEEMQRSMEESSVGISSFVTSTPSSTTSSRLSEKNGEGITLDVRFIPDRRISDIQSPSDLRDTLILTPGQSNKGDSSDLAGGATFVVCAGFKPGAVADFDLTQHFKLKRPSSLGIGGFHDDGIPSEDSSETGLFGQSTPDLESISSMGLSSPEAGIQEESSLRLQTPSQMFESWGDLGDEMEMYKHLRSPSIDNLHFDDEDDTDTKGDSGKEDLNSTVIAPEQTPCDTLLSNSCDNSQQNPTSPLHKRAHDATSADNGASDQCDSSILSVSGYDAMTDSDFNTESEVDDNFGSHPHSVIPNKNRNARVIDGALYTGTTASMVTSGSTTVSVTTSSQSCSTTSEVESTSSGFYSSSESGSLRGIGSRHPSKTTSGSEYECDHDDNTILYGGGSTSSTSTSNPNSTDTSTANSVITHNNQDDSPSNGAGETLDNTLVDADVNNAANSSDDQSHGNGDTRQTDFVKPSSKPKRKTRHCVDDIGVGHPLVAQTRLLREERLRSQSVTCITSVVSSVKPSVPFQHFAKPQLKSSSARSREKALNQATRKQNPETVASSNRLNVSNASSTSGTSSSRFGGSTRSLASSSTSNLASSNTPRINTNKVGNKWDPVMQKIKEGKGNRINVKEVRSKVFDRIGGVSIPSSTKKASSKETSPSEQESSENNEPMIERKIGSNTKGSSSSSTTAASKRIQRTGSTSSDSSEQQNQRTTAKHRMRRDLTVRKRATDVPSNASEKASMQNKKDEKKDNVENQQSTEHETIGNNKLESRKTSVPSTPGKIKSGRNNNGVGTTGTTSSSVADKQGTTTTRTSTIPATPSSKTSSAIRGSTTNLRPNAARTNKTNNTNNNIRPLRDYNRISASSSSKSKEVNASSSSISTKTRETLKDQLSRLKQQLESIEVENASKNKEIEGLNEDNTKLRNERDQCVLQLEQIEAQLKDTKCESHRVTGLLNVANIQLETIKGERDNLKEQLVKLQARESELKLTNHRNIEKLKKSHQALLQQLEKERDELVQTKKELQEELSKREVQHISDLEKLQEKHDTDLDDYKRRCATNTHEVLLKDIDSLNAVLELKNQKIKELELKVETHGALEEQLVRAENLGRTLASRVEDLQTQVDFHKKEKIESLAKMSELQSELEDARGEAETYAKRLDELQFKIENPDVITSPSAAKFKESSVGKAVDSSSSS